jgi:hypothetical protein
MSRALTFWKIAVGLSFTCLLACVVSWFVLLFNLCSNPHTAVAATQNTIPHSCHGATVFITPLEDYLLQWLGPIGLFFILLSFILFAGACHAYQVHAKHSRRLSRR